MTEIDITDDDTGEVVATVRDDGSWDASTDLAEEEVGGMLGADGGALEYPTAVTADGVTATVMVDIEPGNDGYLYAVAESLPSPLIVKSLPEDVESPRIDLDAEEELLEEEAGSGDETPTPEGKEEPERTLLEDTPYTKAELEAACVGSDAVMEKRSDSSGTYFVDLESKQKVYIESPAEAPEGAQVQTGDKGGTYYDTEDVEAFEEAMASVNERVREQYDFSEDEWADAEALQSEYEARADGLFEGIVEAAGIPDDTKATHRVKSTPSMLEKVNERDDASAESLDDLEDVFGAKFVPGDVDEVRAVSENLQENLEDELDLAEIDVDDRLEPDESTYYRAVHVDFETEDGLAGEIQVKSEAMEEIIDVGHDTVYKNNAGLDEEVVGEVDDCLTAQMDALFGESADPDDACTEEARSAIQEVAG